jgi:hypothetical protein
VLAAACWASSMPAGRPCGGGPLVWCPGFAGCTARHSTATQNRCTHKTAAPASLQVTPGCAALAETAAADVSERPSGVAAAANECAGAMRPAACCARTGGSQQRNHRGRPRHGRRCRLRAVGLRLHTLNMGRRPGDAAASWEQDAL